MASVAIVVKSARAEAGLSQTELAKRAGTSQPALARYETGAALPSIGTLERLLSACGQELELRAVPATAPSRACELGPRPARPDPRPATPPPPPPRRRRQARRSPGTRLRIAGPREELPGSDVDLLVDLAPGRTLLDLAAFRREAHGILELPVDVATTDMFKERIRDRVLTDALRL